MYMTTITSRRINIYVLRSIFFTTALLPRLSIIVGVWRTLAWPHHLNKRGDLASINPVQPDIYIEVPVTGQESEWSCMCMW